MEYRQWGRGAPGSRGSGVEGLRATEHAFDKGGHRGRGRGRRLDHTHHFICSIPSARWRGVKTPHAPLYLFYFYYRPVGLLLGETCEIPFEAA